MGKKKVRLCLSAAVGVFVAAETFSLAWTDDPIVAGQTPIRAVHFTELRAAIDAKRSEHSLPVFSWTGSITAGAAPIRAVHITEMRSAILEVYSEHGQSFTFTNDPLIPGVTLIRTLHITELRTAVDGAPPHTTCTCGGWVDKACGGGSCASDKRRQTRTCNPAGCASESRCVDDASCAPCSCTSWFDGACGGGSCASDKKLQTRTCTPDGCDDESRCVDDASCSPAPPVCGNGKCETGENSNNCCKDCHQCSDGHDCCISEGGSCFCGCCESCIFAPLCDNGCCKCDSTPYCCFIAGTKILAPGGLISVEELSRGTTVFSWNSEKNQLGLAQAAEVHRRVVRGFLRVTFSGGFAIEVTSKHPFFDPKTKDYKPIEEFNVGDVVAFLAEPTKGAIVDLEILAKESFQGKEVTVYNLSVGGRFSNFFANGILVHNKCYAPGTPCDF